MKVVAVIPARYESTRLPGEGLEQLFNRWHAVEVTGFGGLGTRLSYNTLQTGAAVVRRLPFLAPFLALAAAATNGVGAVLDRVPGSKPAILRLIATAHRA